MRLALILCLAASLARAETTMSASEFEAWATGHTLSYFDGERLWGSEQHLPGRATLDADADGPCTRGSWQPRGDDICFSYDASPGPHCWRFLHEGGEVFAELLGQDAAPRYRVTRSKAPLSCPGPDVGV